MSSRWLAAPPLEVSIAATVAAADPVALAEKTAEPVLEESAVMVRFCAVSQLGPS